MESPRRTENGRYTFPVENEKASAFGGTCDNPVFLVSIIIIAIVVVVPLVAVVTVAVGCYRRRDVDTVIITIVVVIRKLLSCRQ